MSEHKILSLKETCTGCFACANICPKDAIKMVPNFEGFLMPDIVESDCINCGLCDAICPEFSSPQTASMKKAYYVKASDEIRKTSSSGGAFHLLAENILQEGGVVYGAAFNYENKDVILECRSTDEVPFESLKRSKYVQSFIGYAFRNVKGDLIKGKKVLFCGTPCHIAGLKSYLKKDYGNLITVDFVCHGVPSIDLLNKHLDYIGVKNVVEINFRPKNRNWVDDFEIRYSTENSKKIRLRRIQWNFDEYFGTFEKYQNIRRSCRNCHYCNGQRASDITLADFWGVQNYNKELFDPKGLSLVMANSFKGEGILLSLSNNDSYTIQEIPTKYASYVYSRVRTAPDSPYRNNVRDIFLHDVYTMGYKRALQKNGLRVSRVSLYKHQVKSLIKRLLNRE